MVSGLKPNSFILSILTDTFGFYILMSLSVALALAEGHRVNGQQNQLASLIYDYSVADIQNGKSEKLQILQFFMYEIMIIISLRYPEWIKNP